MKICLLLLLAVTAFAEPAMLPGYSGTFEPEILPEYDSVAIAGYRFAPRSGVPEFPPEWRAPSDYCLIQLRGPVYEYMHKTLSSYGIRVIQYVPFNTFICRANSAQRIAVAELDFVSWVGNYEPAYKVSADLKSALNRVGEGKLDLLVMLFFEESMEQAVKRLSALGTVRETSESDAFKVVRLEMDVSRLAELARLAEVAWIEPWPELVHCNENAQWVTQTWRQGIRRIWAKGVRGETQVVNTADTGILMGSVTHNMVRDPAVPITNWGDFPTHRKVIAYRTWSGSSAAFGDNSAGGWHGTHTAGTICGDDSYVGGQSDADGMAIKAKMYFMDIGTSSGSLSVPGDLTNLYTLPYNGNAGGAARVSSHSWGSTTGAGTYTAYCQQTDRFMWDRKDFLLVYAAGNSGPQASTVIPPGTSKNIITAGATANGTSARQMADFSSRGPCNDTRYKPTVTAPGQTMLSAVGPNANSYGYMQGTSMATPCVAGSAALVRDYFAKGFYPSGESVAANRMSYISAALVKACIINSASADIIGSTIPDNNTGWGRVNLDDVLYFKDDVRRLLIVDDTVGIATGQFREYTVSVNNQAEPLKITLVWTDYPASAGANPAIVNNLDLQVTGPNGVVYRGNQYSGGQSQPNPTSWDNRNVEECVRRHVPEIGRWTIRVNGTNIPQGTRQPFALVVTGGLGEEAVPALVLSGFRLEDPAPGNNNGRLDPGETVFLTDTIRNQSAQPAFNVLGRLRLAAPSPHITLLDTVGYFGDIPVGASAHNGETRFSFSASSLAPAGTVVEFILALEGTGFTQNIPFQLKVGSSGFEVIWGPKPLPSFPSSGFPYGLAYCSLNDRLYVMNAYSRKIYMYSSDSNLTYLGTIPAPDTLGTDIKYCSYDTTFWVAANFNAGGRRVYKILPDGTVLWQFANPANDYPTGLAWVEAEGLLYLADRRTALNTFPQYVYVADTLGRQLRRMDVPLRAAYGARCLAYEPRGPGNGSLLMLYTAFNAEGTAIDSCGVYEFSRSDLSLIQRVLLPGWNCRGIEYDPRDGNYWITMPQSPDRSLAKISGFYGPPTGLSQGARAALARGVHLCPPSPCVFRNQVKLTYHLPVGGHVRLVVYDLSGRIKAVLVDGFAEPGENTVVWNGSTTDGTYLSRGIYFIRLEALGEMRVRRAVIVR